LKNGALSNFSSIRFRNLAQFGHRLASKDFDLQPDFKFALVRPKLAHLRLGNNDRSPEEDKSRRQKTESVLYAKSAVSAESTAETALLKALRESLLANLGAGKAAVVFDSYLAAA
jgi:hypothetical protein